MEHRTIKIEIKNHYGVDRLYPACEIGRLFLKLTGKKTLSRNDLYTILELGFIVTKKEQYADIFKG